MRKLWRFSAALSLAAFAGSLGCSSSPSWLSSPLSLGKSRSGSKFADAPSFNQNYDELAAAQRDRKFVSPALGLGNDGEPGTMKKISNSVTNNRVSKGIKSAWNKTTKKSGDMFTTRKGPAPSSISLAVETGTPDAQLHVAVARLDESKSNFVGAEKKYLEALDDDPAYLDALVGLARLYDRQGNLTKATAYYTSAVEAHPRDATAHNDLGLCYARQNRLQDAAQSLDRAVRLAPGKALYRNNVAKVLVEMGQIEPAVAHLTVAHGEAIAHYNVGYMLHERGENAAAIEHFSLAFERDRELTDAYDWAVALQNESTPMADEGLAANEAEEPAAVTATDDRLASQLPSRPAAPPLTPSWSSGADRSTFPAAAPSPDGATGYAPSEPDPATYDPSPTDTSHRLPPIDTAYRAPSRY